MSCHNFLTSLILTNWEIPLEYKLMACFPNAFAVFSPISFSSRYLYTAYVLLMVSWLDLSTLPCVHLCPNKCALPLSMTLFNSSCFLCCSMPSLGVSTNHQKTHYCLICLQHYPLSLLKVEIATIWRTISDIKVISITRL